MIARYAGASLGLLAFAVTVVAGLCVHNPITVTLSRSVFALFVFCLIGLVLGSVARLVLAEHEQKRRAKIHERYSETAADNRQPAAAGPESIDGVGESIND